MADIKSMDKKKANPTNLMSDTVYGGEKKKIYDEKFETFRTTQDADGYVDAHYDEQLDRDTYRLIGLIPKLC